MIRARFIVWLLLTAASASFSTWVHARQSCSAALPQATPGSDFEDAGPGMVLHKPTGLIWKRCAEGMTWDGHQCRGNFETYTWSGSFKRVEAVNRSESYARVIRPDQPEWVRWLGGAPAGALKPGAKEIESLGASDWRLPNVNELLSIVETQCREPASNVQQLPDSHSSDPLVNFLTDTQVFERPFWSASPAAESQRHAWQVNLLLGTDHILPRNSAGLIRLVRAGNGFHGFDAKTAVIQQTPAESVPVPAPAVTPDDSGQPLLEDSSVEGIETSEVELAGQPAMEPVVESESEPAVDHLASGGHGLRAHVDHEGQDGTSSVDAADLSESTVSLATQDPEQHPEIASVPSLSEWALMILSLLTAVAGLRRLRSR
ncbi:IPTL-CTERM sorting domain-containing protein [Ottowia thiooxydans]|uniref:IPTL-CTERM protein sorting domain-containing protein n=1 Tax=Ottowia thiooxydans TaxID=219182 RepID=A0ABV2QBQ5_9BURK